MPHLGTISSTFYEQLCSRRSRKRKKTYNLPVFFALLGSACVKAACKTLAILTPELCNKDWPYLIAHLNLNPLVESFKLGVSGPNQWI